MEINGQRVVYVAGWMYDEGGGFDWYIDQERAEMMYRNDQSSEEFDRGSHLECHWTAFYFCALLPADVDISNRATVWEYINGEIWATARLPSCDYCGQGCFWDGGEGCDEFNAGGFQEAAA